MTDQYLNVCPYCNSPIISDDENEVLSKLFDRTGEVNLIEQEFPEYKVVQSVPEEYALAVKSDLKEKNIKEIKDNKENKI